MIGKKWAGDRETVAKYGIWLCISWGAYLAAHFLTETLIPYQACKVVYSDLDALIPFCEYFILPYVLWYAWIAGSLLFFLQFSIKSFQNLQKYIIITQAVAIAVYILFPNRQDLRPVVFPRDNIFSRMVGVLYTVDTSTNVCPSLHVAISIGLASVWVKQQDISLWIRCLMVLLAVLVSMSTVFLKQHSVVDGYAAVAVCLLAEWLVFQKKS